MKKESIKIKRIENKENGEKQSKKNKPFEIKLPKLILRNLSFKVLYIITYIFGLFFFCILNEIC